MSFTAIPRPGNAARMIAALALITASVAISIFNTVAVIRLMRRD